MSIFQRCWTTLVATWKKIEYIGVQPGMAYLLNRRIRMVNLIAITTFLISLAYGVGNIVGGHWLLTIVDLGYAIAALFVFQLNHRLEHRKARVHLLISSSVFLCVVNFLSFNIAEYYLLCVLIVSILVFHNIWVQMIISVCLVIAILLPKLFVAQLPYAHAVGEDRLLVNIPIAVLFIFILVRHFKSVQQQYQEQIKQQHIHLEELNRDKEQLFAIVAHDIRSPLIATTQILQLVSEDQIPAQQQKKILQQINAQLTSLTDNVDNLLHWSSQNLQGLVSRPSLFPLAPLIRQIVGSMKAQMQAKSISIELIVDAQLTLYADIEQTRIVFRNLLSNAIKFSYVSTQIVVTAVEQDAIAAISIEDQGVGMSAKQVNELFNQIQRPAYGTSGERGTGLGLVLVRNLLEINGGHITVSSKEKKGTTFSFDLPLLRLADEPVS